MILSVSETENALYEENEDIKMMSIKNASEVKERKYTVKITEQNALGSSTPEEDLSRHSGA